MHCGSPPPLGLDYLYRSLRRAGLAAADVALQRLERLQCTNQHAKVAIIHPLSSIFHPNHYLFTDYK
jgi:hypothetical protein